MSSSVDHTNSMVALVLLNAHTSPLLCVSRVECIKSHKKIWYCFGIINKQNPRTLGDKL